MGFTQQIVFFLVNKKLCFSGFSTLCSDSIYLNVFLELSNRSKDVWDRAYSKK